MRAALAFVLLASCSPAPGEVTTTAAERGAAWVRDPAFAESRFNAFACTTCHPITESDATLPGAPLAGAFRRSTFWGGRITTLAEAVDECATKFMRAPPFDPKKQRWIDVWAYLESIADRGKSEPWPFDVVYAITDLPRGDAARGERVWGAACKSCHGAAFSGQGALTGASVVPRDTLAEHSDEGPSIVRQVVVEKARHGSYLGFAGVMPPFSKQVLSDAQLSDLLTYLRLHD